MAVKRIVTNIAASDTADAVVFYGDFLELDVAMDLGWIVTWRSSENMSVQISVATEGGAGAPVPDLSIEVDNIEEMYARAKSSEFEILYPLTVELWGVRRFYVRDPFGNIVNILSHQ